MASGSQYANDPIMNDKPTSDDPLKSFVADASMAAKSFGSWFTATVNEKAPGLIEKTQKISQDVYSKTKVVAADAYDKASTGLKRATTAVEGFIDQQMEVGPVDSGNVANPNSATLQGQQVLEEHSPLAE